MVAEHYATRRGIPFQQIVRLDLPSGETMNRADYARRLVLPLRQALQKNRLQHSIRVLVTVYGVPLRVESPNLTSEEERVRRDANGRLDVARSQLEDVERRARDLAAQLESNPVPAKTMEERLTAYERHAMFLLRVDDTLQESIKRTKQLNPPALDQWYSRLEAMVRPYQGSAGIAQLHHTFHQGEQASDRDGEAQIRAQYAEGMQLLLGSVELPIRSGRTELYQQVEDLYGAYGVFGLAAMELKLLSAEYADASVDSELTLLWWDRNMYGVAGRQVNPLYHGVKKPPRGSRREIPLLMVSRLDGPNGNVAMHLVDQSMEAEQQGLSGTIYLDARGLTQSDTYNHYDQSLRDLNTFLTQHTTYRTLLENTEVRFHHPGEAPDVALYVGWYRLRHYEDAFTFRPGAIGYHMASAEAVSIHTATESGWCKNALERGIAATLGSIGEPYLDAFPEPLEFVALLTTGQYSLVEAYYLTYAYPLVSADRNGSCFGMPRPSVPKSRRQFQPQFASEDAWAEYLTACRWPDGFRCPRCGQPSAYGLAGRHRWQCASCRYQVSVTAGTVLHNSKTPLTTWFWAAYLMTTDKRGLSALLLQQQRGISRYETAWMMRHKLRRAMVNAARDPLRGEVEMDETWGGTPGRTAGQSPAQRAQRRAGSGCCRTAGAGVRSSPEGGQTRFRRSRACQVFCVTDGG
ncbi:MAG: Mobile element protein [Nitrospira sp.]|nr:Mobile element protein [Nitrospira sp.]